MPITGTCSLPSAVAGAVVGAGGAAEPSGHWQPHSPLLLLLFQLFSPNRGAGLALSSSRSPLHPFHGRSGILESGPSHGARPFGCQPQPAGADSRMSVNFRTRSKCWISFIVKEQILILMPLFVSIPRGFIYFSCFLCKLCRFI